MIFLEKTIYILFLLNYYISQYNYLIYNRYHFIEIIAFLIFKIKLFYSSK